MPRRSLPDPDPLRVPPRPDPAERAPEPFCSSGPSPTLHLVGLGRVARALLAGPTALRARLVGATDSTATVFDRRGLDVARLVAHKAVGRPIAELPGAELLPAPLAIELVAADLVVDAAASDHGAPAAAVARGDAALRRGARLALAAKDGLGAAAERWLAPRFVGRVGCNAVLGGVGARFLAELDELRDTTADVAIVGNATTTTIVAAVEEGASIADGIELARRRGLLEADPELDLTGRDAAVKLAIVATALCGRAVAAGEVGRCDLRGLDVARLVERARRGATTRLVARWDAARGARLAFEELPRTDPLAVPADRVAYGFRRTDGTVRVLIGTGIGPRATAAALAEDVVRLGRDAAGAGS